eukprot:Gb_16452 [translate_table: standard]
MRLSMVEVCNGRVWTSRGFEIGNKHIPLIMMTRLCVKADASIPHLLTDGEVNMKRLPGKKRKAMVFHFLKQGTSPQQILEDMHQWDPVQFWAVVNYLEAHNRIYEALQVHVTLSKDKSGVRIGPTMDRCPRADLTIGFDIQLMNWLTGYSELNMVGADKFPGGWYSLLLSSTGCCGVGMAMLFSTSI